MVIRSKDSVLSQTQPVAVVLQGFCLQSLCVCCVNKTNYSARCKELTIIFYQSILKLLFKKKLVLFVLEVFVNKKLCRPPIIRCVTGFCLSGGSVPKVSKFHLILKILGSLLFKLSVKCLVESDNLMPFY